MRRWIDSLTRRTVVVHLTAGESIRGILVGVYTDSLVLDHAAFLASDSVSPVDGSIVIPRGSVSWMQTLEDK